eukprot:jgi/Tetstr1/457383/TSEL_043985.t1
MATSSRSTATTTTTATTATARAAATSTVASARSFVGGLGADVPPLKRLLIESVPAKTTVIPRAASAVSPSDTSGPLAVCAALAERCVCQPVEALYSSDLRRCVETAQPIAAALDLQLCTREALRERHLGVLQGLTKGEAHIMEPAAWSALLNGSDADRVPGGGESVEDLASRAQGAIDDIARKHPGGRVIVVTHGGVLAQLHCLAAGHCSGAPSINCSINSLLVEPGRWALLRWGGVQHLQAGSYAAHAFGGGGRSG